MGLLTINQFQILAFTLVFLRCLAFFVSWPIFSGTNLPVQVKVLLSLLVGMICFSLIPPESYPKIEAYPTMIGLGIKEMAIGFAIGFLANLIFHGVMIAGELISMAMGLSASQMFNPSTGVQQSSINQLYYFFAAFLFLAIRGHHYFIKGLYQSFELVPLSVIFPRISEIGQFAMLGAKVIEVGLMLAAPVLVSILLINFSLGILGRAVPQINVLITSLPINALAGLIICIIVLPFFLESLKAEMIDFTDIIFSFLRTF